MKRFFLFLLLFVLASMQVQTQAQQTIHWLLFIDTEDANVGDLDKNGRDWLKHHFVDNVNAVLVNAGLQHDVQLYDGNRLTPQNCKSAVQNLSCGPNDIVFFYYIGHGGRSIGENDREHPWPKMWLGQREPNMMVDLGWVHDQLKAKNPRLLLTIGMCCNVKQNLPIGRTPTFGVTYGDDSRYYSDEQIAGIKKLFLESRGDILATSASPGQSSVGGDLPDPFPDMDVYTALFVALFEIEMDNPDLSWSLLFDELAVAVKQATNNGQSPIYRTGVSSASSVDPGRRTPPPPIDRSNILNSLEVILDDVVVNQEEPDGISSLFTSNATVKVVGEDGSTVVHSQNWDKFLLRISTSSIIMKATPINFKMSGDKISELTVKEYYKSKEQRR